VIHDVALQNLPVIFCLDRAGLVGEDGATHHGVFDLAYLRCIPNMMIYAPKDEIALQNMLYTASLGLNHPIAIRYPRGRGKILDFRFQNLPDGSQVLDFRFEKIEIGKAELLKEGSTTAVLSTGFIGNNVSLALENLDQPEHIAHYDFGFVKPLDEPQLHAIFQKFKKIITIEDGVIKGGFGSAILEFARENNYHVPIQTLGIPDAFIEHGTVNELQQICKIDVKSLVNLFSI
jgi:1-deoxy-D-xylulose-5-phosphate synthase